MSLSRWAYDGLLPPYDSRLVLEWPTLPVYPAHDIKLLFNNLMTLLSSSPTSLDAVHTLSALYSKTDFESLNLCQRAADRIVSSICLQYSTPSLVDRFYETLSRASRATGQPGSGVTRLLTAGKEANARELAASFLSHPLTSPFAAFKPAKKKEKVSGSGGGKEGGGQ